MKKIKKIPEHIGIIMDGNGRYALKKKKPRTYGHLLGGRNIFNVIQLAISYGIKNLTLFAFSTENWKRSEEEVDFLMKTPIEYYNKYKDKLKEVDYKVKFIGRKDRISNSLKSTFEEIENLTKDNDKLTVNICFDYGSIDELILNIKSEVKDEKDLLSRLWIKEEVDLIIRTGNEFRLSNFCLIQSRYAEIFFSKKYWPQFGKSEFQKALIFYSKRNRRFGKLS
ncbi:MAG: di-trans,poly-cis-decaprenylcistransferase [Acholeplasmatales bacterium]|jgi:undecaprenyl diphosphate synthase|nr:di-trans,poly-cis-decaprenylcistransferase [Acholeplasmatales bacterium]